MIRLPLLGSALLVALALAAAPAPACGCGVLAPEEGAQTSVSDERSLVVFDGARETIVMRLGVQGESSSLAWLMPLPAPARIRLGDEAVFGELDRLSEPREIEKRRWKFLDLGDGGGEGAAPTAGAPGAAGGSGVDVVTSQRLGPLDVVTLRAREPRALEEWLTDNGYATPEGFAGPAAVYLEQGWLFMAAKLRPTETATAPTGEALQPLVMAFPARAPVYPLRLSSLAEREQSVRVDVVAPHRVDWTGLGRATEPVEDEELSLDAPVSVLVAAPLEAEDLRGAPALARELGGGALGERFLTSFQGRFEPDAFTTDPVLRRSASNDEFHRTDVEYEDVYVVNEFGPWVLLLLVLTAGAVAFLVVARRRRSAS